MPKVHVYAQGYSGSLCPKLHSRKRPLCFPLVALGMGRGQEGIQGRLARVAEASERGAAEGVVLPCPAVLLVAGPDLHPPGPVNPLLSCTLVCLHVLQYQLLISKRLRLGRVADL